MNEPRNIRLVILITATEEAALADYWHSRRLPSRSEAARDLMNAGFEARGIMPDGDLQQPDLEQLEPPAIPEPEAIGRPVLGEVVLPWLREQGRRSYAVGEVVDSVFGATANQPGRAQAVTAIFKAMGWTQTQKRDGRTVVQTFTAP